MKKTLFMLMSALLLCYACSDEKDDVVTLHKVTLKLTSQIEVAPANLSGVDVSLKTADGTTLTAKTEADATASFRVPAGIYMVSASCRFSENGYAYVLNGVKENVVVSDKWDENSAVTLEMVASRAGQLVIKELYVGGCQANTATAAFQRDQYVVLYNNSDQVATLENLAMGFVPPHNSQASNTYYNENGLLYENMGFIPIATAIVYFQHTLTLQPYSQVVVAITGAIDHTATYTNSVNLSNADYCVYDPTVFTHALYYPAPSSTIPSSNYLKAVLFGLGNAWGLSNHGPALIVFSVKEGDALTYATNDENLWKKDEKSSTCLKIPTDWILDAVEVYSATNLDKSKKRLTAAVDAGYTPLTNKYGHTSYRNVDKEATEAIAENSGKLVYGYDKGMENATDPSGIDAEASMKKGARIVYKDTNNSTNDFHERQQASLKD